MLPLFLFSINIFYIARNVIFTFFTSLLTLPNRFSVFFFKSWCVWYFWYYVYALFLFMDCKNCFIIYYMITSLFFFTLFYVSRTIQIAVEIKCIHCFFYSVVVCVCFFSRYHDVDSFKLCGRKEINIDYKKKTRKGNVDVIYTDITTYFFVRSLCTANQLHNSIWRWIRQLRVYPTNIWFGVCELEPCVVFFVRCKNGLWLFLNRLWLFISEKVRLSMSFISKYTTVIIKWNDNDGSTEPNRILEN